MNPITNPAPVVQKNYKKRNVLLFIIGGIFLLLVTLLILDSFKIISLSRLFSLNYLTSLQPKIPISADTVIFKVGEENIYQKDLTTELSLFPKVTEEQEQQVRDKLVRDSIILQAAQEETLIKLDTTVFNSLDKDYLKRIQLVNEVKDKLENDKDRYAGSVISIWFYNTKPGAIGYEQGKARALKKITQLQTDVKQGKLTMEQAAKLIENDVTLAQVDPAYKANAYFQFDTELKKDIVFDKDFNGQIKRLQPGQVSDVVLVKDKERINNELTGKMIDAVYMFARVTERKITGKNLGFDDWITKRKTKYEIIIY